VTGGWGLCFVSALSALYVHGGHAAALRAPYRQAFAFLVVCRHALHTISAKSPLQKIFADMQSAQQRRRASLLMHYDLRVQRALPGSTYARPPAVVPAGALSCKRSKEVALWLLSG